MTGTTVMLLVIMVGHVAMQDVDHDVALQMQRQDFISNKLIDRVADEEEKYHLDLDPKVDTNFAAKDSDDYFTDLHQVIDAHGRAMTQRPSSTHARSSDMV